MKYVEKAFRTMKQSHLEIRPLYVRKTTRTDGHALVVMLAYRIVLEIEKSLKDLNLTVKEAIDSLAQISITEIKVATSSVYKIPVASEQNQKILNALNIIMPKTWPPESCHTKQNRVNSL